MTGSETSAVLPDNVTNRLKVPEFLQHGRKNPINGIGCFFSEASYRKVIGPEPSFHDRLMIQVARVKERSAEIPNNEPKKRRKDLDLPQEEKSQQKEDAGGPAVKLSKVEIFPQEPGDSNVEEGQSDGSEDDDESFSNLVISDVPENAGTDVSDKHAISSKNFLQEEKMPLHLADGSLVKPEGTIDLKTCEKFKTDPGQSISSDRLCTGDVARITEKVVKETVEIVNTNQAKTPLYAIGLAGSSSRFSLPGLDQEEPVAPTTEKGEEQTVDTECLVMPPINPDSDGDGAEQQETEQPQSSGFGLPLIPALMSQTPARRTSDITQKSLENILEKPVVSHLFYSAGGKSAASDPLGSQAGQSNTVSKARDPVADVDEEIPIFSLAVNSPDAADAGVKRSLRNKSLWSTEMSDLQEKQSGKPKSTDNTVKQAMKFRQSALTRDEMARYLQLHNKFVSPYLLGGCPPMFTNQQRTEMEEFEALKERVVREQGEFQTYLQQNAIRNPQFYTIINPRARHYASIKAQSYRPHKKMTKLFSENFSTKFAFKQSSPRVDLSFQQVLLETGSAPKLVLPDVKCGNNPVTIPHDLKKIEANFPRSQRNRAPGVIHHEKVSDDINAQTLALKYGADVVFSSSVFKCLMNNLGPDYTCAWNIPVLVREHRLEDRRQKVVYLNKPVFEEKLHLRDYNAIFHKYALRAMVAHPKQAGPRGTQNQRWAAGGRRAKAADDPFDIFSTDLEGLETFGKTGNLHKVAPGYDGVGKDTPKKVASTDAQKSKSLDAESVKESEGSREEGRQQDDASDATNDKLSSLRKRPAQPSESSSAEQVLSPAKKGTAAQFKQKRKVVSLTVPNAPTEKGKQSSQPQFSISGLASGISNPLDLILGPGAEAGGKKDSQEDPSEYMPHSEELSSLVYSLWNLDQTKVLCRTRSHGTLKLRNVYLTTKMEYQLNYGYEQVTTSEMIKDWSVCFLRPNTKLIRTRINAYNSEMMMVEELETHQILKSSSNFRPEEGFSFINNVIKQLSSLGSGNYLLSHEPGADHCGLRVLKTGARFDDKYHGPPRPADKQAGPGSVPWIPIDTVLMLPQHMAHQRVPATFLPKDVVVTNPGTKKPKPDAATLAKIAKKKKKNRNRKLKSDREWT